MSPDVLTRRVGACALGRRVTVLLAGKSYELPLKAEQQPAPAPNPLEEFSRQVLSTVQAVKAGQLELAGHIAQVSMKLGQPVKPIYDASGVLIGAQRVDTLDER